MPAAVQDAGDFSGLDAAYDELQGVLPVEGGPEFDTLHIVLEFLDGWTDARNHDWLYYEGISQRDWPRLARTIAADLRADRQTLRESSTGALRLPRQEAASFLMEAPEGTLVEWRGRRTMRCS